MKKIIVVKRDFVPTLINECLVYDINIATYKNKNSNCVEVGFDDEKEKISMFIHELAKVYKYFLHCSEKNPKTFSSQN